MGEIETRRPELIGSGGAEAASAPKAPAKDDGKETIGLRGGFERNSPDPPVEDDVVCGFAKMEDDVGVEEPALSLWSDLGRKAMGEEEREVSEGDREAEAEFRLLRDPDLEVFLEFGFRFPNLERSS